MKKNLFEREMNRAQSMRSVEYEKQNYWAGYMRGLRRRYHGSDFGTEDEHQLWLTASGDETRCQRSQGYRDGFYGPVDWSDLPQAVKTIRVWRGWSTDELGMRCGSSGRTIENWEQGRTAIPDAKIKTLKFLYESE